MGRIMRSGIGFLVVCCLLVGFVHAIGLTSSERSVIVTEHNNVRTNVNPPANPPIPNVSYDANIETNVAGPYASQCVIAHNPNRGQLGENIYAESPYTSFTNALRNAMFYWAGEVQYYTITATSQSCQSGKVCGHYTQVVWENSTTIGCGVANCNNMAFVVCNYSPPGNWNNLLPYRVATGGTAASPSPTASRSASRTPSQNAPVSATSSPTPTKSISRSGTRSPSRTPSKSVSQAACQSGCPAGFCGSYTSCGGTYNCNCGSGSYCNSGTCTACPNVCTGTNCGSIARPNGCTAQTCACSDTSFVCSSNQCTAPACNIQQQCASLGKTCGTWSVCGQQASCGTCSASQTCNNGQCVSTPCNGACDPVSQVCTNNACVCAAGYTQTTNGCVLNQAGSGPNFQQDFVTVKGANFAFLDFNQLTVYGASDTVIAWQDTIGVINKDFSVVEFDVTAPSGAFGVTFRLGQPGYPYDRVQMFVSNLGGSPVVNFGYVYRGNEGGFNFGSFGGWRSGQSNHIKTTLTRGSGNVIVQWEQNGWMYQGALTDVFGDAGAFGFYISGSGSPYMENLIMFTTSTITVSLFECQDVNNWIQRFLTATGSPPGTTVEILDEEGIAACKGAVTGEKAAASGAFTFSVTSSTISSQAIAHNFVTAVNTGSASVISGPTGAALAGAPVIGPSTIIVPIGGAGAGGAGLPGGAIAGIVIGSVAGGLLILGLAALIVAAIIIGSVAGGLLILGLAALIVAAIIVAAVVVAKKRSSSSNADHVPEPEEGPTRGGIRQSIYSFFRPRGGVDVMNNPSKGHQSITARAPAIH